MRTGLIPLHKIVLPEHLHRVELDQARMLELADSIRDQGLINAISVRALNLTYHLIAGHRRLVAHQMLGRPHIRATIYEEKETINTNAIRFAENLNRTDLSPMEEARALNLALTDGDMTVEKIARMVNRSPAWVEQRIMLLGLADELSEPVHQKRLGIAAALELNKVEDHEHRAYLTRYALDAGATTQVIREWVQQWLIARAAGNAANAPRPEMPVAGQTIIIQIPCYVCTTPFAHEHMRILRVCPACTAEIAGVGAAHQHQQPAPAAAPSITNPQ